MNRHQVNGLFEGATIPGAEPTETPTEFCSLGPDRMPMNNRVLSLVAAFLLLLSMAAAIFACEGSEKSAPLVQLPSDAAVDPDTCEATLCPAALNLSCPGTIAECAAALRYDGRIEILETGSERRLQEHYLKEWLCHLDSASSSFAWARERVRTGGGSIGWGGFSFGMNAASSDREQRAEYDAWLRSRCEEDIRSLNDEAISTLLVHIEDTTAPLTAWAQCVRDVVGVHTSCVRASGGFGEGLATAVQGLALLTEPTEVPDGGTFSLWVRYCGPVGSVEATAATLTAFHVEGASCELGDRFNAGTPVCAGDMTIPCRRTTREAVRFSMEVRARLSGGAERNVFGATALKPLCGLEDGPCCEGSCRFPGNECVDGWCVSQCDIGQRRCPDGRCDEESPISCGPSCEVCEPPSGGMATCEAHVCGATCVDRLELCGDQCIDVQRDAANCGSCGRSCGGGQVCSSGQCECPNDGVFCNGQCRSSCNESCNDRDDDGDGAIDDGGVCTITLPQGTLFALGKGDRRPSVTFLGHTVTRTGGCPSGYLHETWPDHDTGAGGVFFGCLLAASTAFNVVPAGLVTRLGHRENGSGFSSCSVGERYIRLGDSGANFGIEVCERSTSYQVRYANRSPGWRHPCGLSHTDRAPNVCASRLVSVSTDNCVSGYHKLFLGDLNANAGQGLYTCIKN